ncbi:MAG TPA: MFS transporter [Acidimicrobiia bacterium]|nr:MFS transporter [Acidimicrobiia bacterium]
MKAARLTPDARRILWAQAMRAFAYGFGAVLLGTTLDREGFSSGQVGLVLAAVVAGTVVSSLAVGRWGDRFGRRRSYVVLYLALAVTGVVFAFSDQVWALSAVALTGALSTEVVESGAFTSLEQSMLATELTGRERIRGFGTYNAVATAAGSLGALAAGAPDLLRRIWSGTPVDQRFFLLFVPAAFAGAAVACTLSRRVEADPRPHEARPAPGLQRSRPTVLRLAGLFAVDSFGGGFVVQSFIAYWFAAQYDASTGELGIIFFGVGVLQTLSFLAAARLAERFGLLRTMVFTHLPSNGLLIAIPFAPTLLTAALLLFGRTALAQMDVPTRQAYVMALVDPDERTPAAAVTNTARYVVRPVGPALAGVSQSIAFGLPFFLAGAIKSVYDVVLWRWFRTVPLPDEPARSDVRK